MAPAEAECATPLRGKTSTHPPYPRRQTHSPSDGYNQLLCGETGWPGETHGSPMPKGSFPVSLARQSLGSSSLPFRPGRIRGPTPVGARAGRELTGSDTLRLVFARLNRGPTWQSGPHQIASCCLPSRARVTPPSPVEGKTRTMGARPDGGAWDELGACDVELGREDRRGRPPCAGGARFCRGRDDLAARRRITQPTAQRAAAEGRGIFGRVACGLL